MFLAAIARPNLMLMEMKFFQEKLESFLLSPKSPQRLVVKIELLGHLRQSLFPRLQHQKAPRTIDELVANVEKAFEDFP